MVRDEFEDYLDRVRSSPFGPPQSGKAVEAGEELAGPARDVQRRERRRRRSGNPHGNPHNQRTTPLPSAAVPDRGDLTSRIAEANRQATRLQRCDALAVELINTSAAAILLAQDYEPTDDELLEIEEAMSKLIPRLQANGCVTDEEAEALADNRDFLLQGMRQDVLTFVEDSDDNIQRIVFGLL